MRIPHTVNENTLKAYKLSSKLYKTHGEIYCDNFQWDNELLKTLREMCLIILAKNWKENPLYHELIVPNDRSELVDHLPCDLPLNLTVDKIEDDHYWERVYFHYWPNILPPNRKLNYAKIIEIKKSKRTSSDVNLKTWKTCFLEKYLQEALENMKPSEYNPEYIKDLTDLCGDYVLTLNIRQLLCSESKDSTSHISMHSLLTRLPNLIELSICFTQGKLADRFSWHPFKISLEDCELLANGIEKSKINILRILRCDINHEKLNPIVQSLLIINEIKLLDLTNCRIGDEGALLICRLIEETEIETIILINNQIGPIGTKAIANSINSSKTKLTNLNLRLNSLRADGGSSIISAINNGTGYLKCLSLSACHLSNKNFNIGETLIANKSLIKLDLSNNYLGEEIGRNILKSLEINKTIITIDLRMCGVPQEIRSDIEDKLQRNWKDMSQILNDLPFCQEYL